MWQLLVHVMLVRGATQDAYDDELSALQAAAAAAAAAQAQHQTCSVGWRWNAYSSACEICPPGRFQALPGTTECAACPHGEYQLLEGQAACTPNTCPAGTAVTAAGCEACAPGQAAGLGDAACHACDAALGEYAYASGAANCTQSACTEGYQQTSAGCVECGADEFQDLTGQPFCRACPPGFSSLPGAAACVNISADALEYANAVREHAPAPARRCTHLSCQYNGHHIQVQHHGREQHGMRHHCFYHSYGAPHGECYCMCATHELGDDLYMLIPHRPHHSVAYPWANATAFRPSLWQLHDEQRDALQLLGFALPSQLEAQKQYYGFHDDIEQRQQQHAASGGVLHWARKAV